MAANVNIAELVEQMPDTDKEVQARLDAEKKAKEAQAGTAPASPRKEEKPDRWGAASKFTGPEPQFANSLFEQALAGGRKTLVELMALVLDPADPGFKSYKAEYFLHALAVYSTAPGREKDRKEIVAALAEEADNARRSPASRAVFVRELRLIGGKDVVPGLGKLLRDEALCADAAAALVSIRDGAAGPLRDALSNANGRCRAIIVQSLGVLKDEKSLGTFRRAVTDADADVRLASGWALARLADPSAVDLLLKAADVPPGWERIKATQACLLLAENLSASGRRAEAVKIYTHLRSTRTDPGEKYVRDIAAKALGTAPVGEA